MNKEIIKIERKIIIYCLKKINRYDLINSLNILSDKEIHQMYLQICKKYKEGI